MALSKMKIVSIIGMMPYLDNVVTALGKSGVFQPDDATEFFSETKNFLPVASRNEYAPVLEKVKNILAAAKVEPKIVDTDGFDASLDELENYVNTIWGELGALIEEKDNTQREIESCNRRIENSAHFVGLELEIDKVEACEYVKTNFGRIPKDSYDKLQAYADNPFIEFFPCSSDDDYYWGVYAAPLEQVDEIDRVFSGLYFEHCEVAGLKGTPTNFVAQQKTLLAELEQRVVTLDKEIKKYDDEHSEIMLKVYTKLMEHSAFFAINSHAYRYNKSFILVGWITAQSEKMIKDTLSAIESVEATFADAKDEIKHSPPVKLKNCFLARPFEFYTQMYGLPNYREIDPSGFIALTYTILFGIMFGDVGHGIMLFACALFMWKKMNMMLGKLLLSCAVSSTVFGFVYGSVFGFEEVLNPMYKALFGLDEKPISVMSSDMTMTIIYSAVGIGIFLLMVAMCLNIYSSVKQGNLGTALFGVNGLCGLVFYSSLVVGLICSLLLDIHIMTPLYIIGLVILPLVLIFFREPLSLLVAGKKNWLPESMGSFIVDNLFELFEVCLSYVTNTMSFLRVGAFVLVHAGMMQVVFVLAGMFGNVGYAITVVIGNILVMGLEALLVGIQVLRLEYYEMFSRFYVGDGRPYKPVNVKEN